MRNNTEAIKQLGDVVYLAAKAFEGRNFDTLTPKEQLLVLELQKGQFLTKIPDDDQNTGQARS